MHEYQQYYRVLKIASLAKTDIKKCHLATLCVQGQPLELFVRALGSLLLRGPGAVGHVDLTSCPSSVVHWLGQNQARRLDLGRVDDDNHGLGSKKS